MRKIFFAVFIIGCLYAPAIKAQTAATVNVNTGSILAQIDSTIVGFSFNPSYLSMNFSNSYNGINTRQISNTMGAALWGNRYDV